MTDLPASPSALRAQREQTIARLCAHFAQDHLEAEELEQLIDRAHRATTRAELDELLRPLPALTAAPPPAPEASAAPPARTSASTQGQQLVLALLGSNERMGAWTPARTLHVVAVMGGVRLDLRQAQLQPGVTEVFVLALMGGVEVVVPPGVRVESNGVGIMGGFDHRGAGKTPVDTSVPILRINGVALLGGVEISELAPGELPRNRHHRHRHRRLERGEPRDGSGWTG